MGSKELLDQMNSVIRQYYTTRREGDGVFFSLRLSGDKNSLNFNCLITDTTTYMAHRMPSNGNIKTEETGS